VVDVRLLPLRRINPRLPDLDDRSLLIALHQLGYRWLITNNYRMLRNPKELAAILKTKLTVFAIERVGDDPLRATGAILLDLPVALKRVRADRAQVFWLRPRDPQPVEAWDLFRTAAERHHRNPEDLYEEVKVSGPELNADVLGL
jgi:hypothetical protein